MARQEEYTMVKVHKNDRKTLKEIAAKKDITMPEAMALIMKYISNVDL